MQVESVNGNEAAVAGLIDRVLASYGIRGRLVGESRSRKSYIAKIGAGRRSLMFNGHLDTVPFGDIKKWRFSPTAGTIKGGRLYGRGSFDMKGSVAAMAFAAAAVAATRMSLPGQLKLVFNYDEESGVHSGIRDIVKRGISADAAIVGEPLSDNTLRIGAKGTYRFRLHSFGRTGHTAYRGRGEVNAVTNMARMLLALEKVTVDYKKHSLFSRPLITPGTVIEGGVAINVFPGSCSALVDCRLTMGQRKLDFKKAIEKTLFDVQREFPSVRYRIEDLVSFPPVCCEKSEPIVVAARQSLSKILGSRIKLGIMEGITDGTILADAGIPNVIFGACGDRAHSEDEYVSVSSMVQICKAYVVAAFEFLGRR